MLKRPRSAVRSATRANLKRTIYEFVLEYGWWYAAAEVPRSVEAGKQQQCHRNAAILARDNDSMVYCEGLALFKSGMSPTIHAWATDGDGNAFDNTWTQPGVAYAGVPFKSLFVLMTTIKNRATIGLLDDWGNGWPLLGDLGDRPDEWLEDRGKGVAKIQ
jgi:hypothetical protein